jgi:hypothetical protein
MNQKFKTMKFKYTSIYFILILFIIFGSGCILFNKFTNQSSSKSIITPTTQTERSNSPTETVDEILLSPSFTKEKIDEYTDFCYKELTSAPMNENRGGKVGGLISGRVYYPSEGLPDGLQVCAYDISNKVRYCNSEIHARDGLYELHIPEGKYYVYTLSLEGLIGVGGMLKTESQFRIFVDEAGNIVANSPLIVEIVEKTKMGDIAVGDQIINRTLFCPEIFKE